MVWAGSGRLAWRLKLASTTTVKRAKRLVAVERQKVHVLRELLANDVESILRFGGDGQRAQSVVQKAEEIMARCVQVEAALRCLCTLRSRQALDGPQARDFHGASATECVTGEDAEALTQEEVEMDLGSSSPLAPTRRLRLIVLLLQRLGVWWLSAVVQGGETNMASCARCMMSFRTLHCHLMCWLAARWSYRLFRGNWQ